jgi:hypothetical protein
MLRGIVAMCRKTSVAEAGVATGSFMVQGRLTVWWTIRLHAQESIVTLVG